MDGASWRGFGEGEFHRRQRKLMAPVFQPRHIASYADTISQYGERIQQEWQNGALIDLNSQMIALTMSVIASLLPWYQDKPSSLTRCIISPSAQAGKWKWLLGRDNV
jgi:cytochrome P450